MGLYQTTAQEPSAKLKGNTPNEKKISTNHLSDKRLTSKIYKELIKQNCKRRNNLIKNRVSEVTSFQRRLNMTYQCMKRFSTLLISREMEIQTIMRYYLTPIRMDTIKKTKNNKCWQRCRENALLVVCKLAPLWKTVQKFLKKLKIQLQYDSATKTLTQKDICTSMVLAALPMIAKTGKHCSVSIRIDK